MITPSNKVSTVLLGCEQIQIRMFINLKMTMAVADVEVFPVPWNDQGICSDAGEDSGDRFLLLWVQGLQQAADEQVEIVVIAGGIDPIVMKWR